MSLDRNELLNALKKEVEDTEFYVFLNKISLIDFNIITSDRGLDEHVTDSIAQAISEHYSSDPNYQGIIKDTQNYALGMYRNLKQAFITFCERQNNSSDPPTLNGTVKAFLHLATNELQIDPKFAGIFITIYADYCHAKGINILCQLVKNGHIQENTPLED